jgi:hypothetical protein
MELIYISSLLGTELETPWSSSPQPSHYMNCAVPAPLIRMYLNYLYTAKLSFHYS